MRPSLLPNRRHDNVLYTNTLPHKDTSIDDMSVGGETVCAIVQQVWLQMYYVSYPFLKIHSEIVVHQFVFEVHF